MFDGLNALCLAWIIDSTICVTIIGIYVNKNLRLDNVQVYGFDYDYTLAHYSADVQALIYDLAKEHLVNEVCSIFLNIEFVV